MESNRRVAPKVLVKEAATTQPKPVETIESVICVKKLLLEVCSSLFPGLPKIASGKKAGDGMPSEMVNPSLSPELGHAGINPGESSLSLLPRLHAFLVLRPGNLAAIMVPPHISPAARITYI